MMKHLDHLAFVGIWVALSTSCAVENSSSVNQDRIHTVYSATFEESNRAVNASAHFYFGNSLGTYLKLDGDSEVLFNGIKMAEHQSVVSKQLSYESSRSNLSEHEHEREFSFYYRNNGGRVYVNTFRFPRGLLSQVSSGTARRSDGLSARWTSDVPVKGLQEEVELVYSWGSGTGGQLTSEGDDGMSGEAFLTPKQLEAVGRDPLRIKFCRRSVSGAIHAPQAGGRLTVSRCTPETVVSWID